jgi:hypothetical protein
MMQGILMTRRRRAAGIEPPRQRCINLNIEEEYEEEEGTVEDTEKRREGSELFTTAMQGVQFSVLFRIKKSWDSPVKRLGAVWMS